MESALFFRKMIEIWCSDMYILVYFESYQALCTGTSWWLSVVEEALLKIFHKFYANPTGKWGEGSNLATESNDCLVCFAGPTSGIRKHGGDSVLLLLQSQQSFSGTDNGNWSTTCTYDHVHGTQVILMLGCVEIISDKLAPLTENCWLAVPNFMLVDLKILILLYFLKKTS